MPFDQLDGLEDDAIIDALVKVKGVGDLLDNCATTANAGQTDGDGETSTVTLTKMLFDTVGDETAAIKFTVQGAFPFSGDMVFVRQDAVVLAVATMTLDSADAGDTIQGTPLAYYFAKIQPITGGHVHPMAAAMITPVSIVFLVNPSSSSP